MINETVWFYTLSTIAQTCAAILALGGTFIVFKLDKVQTALNNYRNRVVGIIQTWRRGSKQPDKFYDESDKDILGQYRTIVSDNNEDIFDKSDIVELIKRFERVKFTTVKAKGIYEMDNGVLLDHEERKRWCERMAGLFKKNIKIEHDIFDYLKQSIILLTSSIFLSIFTLFNIKNGIAGGFTLFLLFIVIFSLIAITYSAFAVWKIAKSKPIL
ncbi:MAG: hypothetical protein M0Q93_00960 [Terrimicrobiaceae bacterium]|nr:hypothetical protein [Terrimicrobiaceae bacterium]